MTAAPDTIVLVHGEAQFHLGLDRAHPDHPNVARGLDQVVKQCGLADSGDAQSCCVALSVKSPLRHGR
jgi:hypothetical protein